MDGEGGVGHAGCVMAGFAVCERACCATFGCFCSCGEAAGEVGDVGGGLECFRFRFRFRGLNVFWYE